MASDFKCGPCRFLSELAPAKKSARTHTSGGHMYSDNNNFSTGGGLAPRTFTPAEIIVPRGTYFDKYSESCAKYIFGVILRFAILSEVSGESISLPGKSIRRKHLTRCQRKKQKAAPQRAFGANSPPPSALAHT